MAESKSTQTSVQRQIHLSEFDGIICDRDRDLCTVPSTKFLNLDPHCDRPLAHPSPCLESLEPEQNLKAMASSSTPARPTCKHLVLDAGPLLSLSPLRGLAETYYTVPQVLDELKDKRAREHFERLGLSAGVRIEVRGPDAAALAHGESVLVERVLSGRVC